MKTSLKMGAIASACLFAWNCGDDSSSNPPAEISSSSEPLVCDLSAYGTFPLWTGAYFIGVDGSVSDGTNTVGTFDFATGSILDASGATIATLDASLLPYFDGTKLIYKNCLVTKVDGSPLGRIDEDGNFIPGTVNISSSNSGDNPDLPQSSESVDPGSSATLPVSSGEDASSSSAFSVVSSSSFIKSPLSEMDLSGYPVASYQTILGNGTYGWNTRYWDACKPHCSWISDGKEGRTDTTTQASYEAGMTTARNCNIHDVEVPTFTLGHAVQQYWMGYEGTTSACVVGASGVFTCTDMAPIAVNDTLSYAYVAGPSNSICGKCYHLQYDGSFKDVNDNNKPKATHKALKGKHIIVMSSNIGHDVKEGQFDLMVPGGGVGNFDALSTQVNKGSDFDWGAQYGGFLTSCQNSLGYDASLAAFQNCIRDKCELAFAGVGLDNLYRGCMWFADWYMAADNPTYQWEEVECPQYLVDHYKTTINPTKENRFKWHDDWSSYNGEELETLDCLTDEFPQGCDTSK